MLDRGHRHLGQRIQPLPAPHGRILFKVNSSTNSPSADLSVTKGTYDDAVADVATVGAESAKSNDYHSSLRGSYSRSGTATTGSAKAVSAIIARGTG